MGAKKFEMIEFELNGYVRPFHTKLLVYVVKSVITFQVTGQCEFQAT